MSKKTSKKSKGNTNGAYQMLNSRSITQIVCFVIVATAAVFGFVQARRALYELGGDSSSVTTRDKYSDGGGDNGEAVDSDGLAGSNGHSVFHFSTTSAVESTESTETTVSTQSTESPSTTTTSEAKKSKSEKTTTGTTKVYDDSSMVRITVSPVNIRSGAGTKYKVIARTARGKTYRLLSSRNGADGREWRQIALPDNKKGWILSSCCQIVDENDFSTTAESVTSTTTAKSTTAKSTTADSGEESVTVKVTPVNIRSGAGSKYKVIARAVKGERYRLLSKKKGKDGKAWYQVALGNGKSGWIKGSYCKLTNGSAEKTETTAKSTTSTSAATKSPASTSTTVKSTTAKSTTAKSTTAKTTTTSKNGSDTKKGSVEITVSPVNIRSGPGMGYRVISRTSRGKTFGLISVKQNSDGKQWCEIALEGGKSGWILYSCCRINRDGSNATTAKSTTAKSTTAKSTTAKSTTAKSTTAKSTTTKSTTSSKTAVSSTTTEKAKDKLIMSLQPTEHSAKYFIVVYKGSQSVVVYGKDKNGDYTKAVKTFTCSTGKKSSPTRTGKYRIRAKYRWRWLVGNVYGQFNSSISSDYLFHSVPYHTQDASTLENEEYDKLGSPASKGCIRMCVRDCKWIYDNCKVGTDVRIVNDSGPAGPGVPKRKTQQRYSGWDPSDKWAEDNPYFS